MSHHLLDRLPTDWMPESPREVCRLDVRAARLATPLTPMRTTCKHIKNIIHIVVWGQLFLLLLSKQ